MKLGKVCNKCNEYKDYSEFYENKSLSDGHNYSCKTCEKTYQLEYKRKRRTNILFLIEERKRDLERYHRNDYKNKRKK